MDKTAVFFILCLQCLGGIFFPLRADLGLIIDINTPRLEPKSVQKTREKFLSTFGNYLSQQCSQRISFQFESNEVQAVEFLQEEKMNFALIRLGFYLKYAKDLSLKVVLQEIPVQKDAYTFYLVLPPKKYSSLEEFLKTDTPLQIVSSYGKEEVFLRRIALGLRVPESITFKQRTFVDSDIEKLIEGDYAAILLDGKQYRALSEEIREKVQAFAGPSLAGHLLVRINEVAFPEELQKAFQELSEKEEGKEFLKTMQVRKFQEVKDKEFHELIKFFHATE
jgi:hypothetical protein